MNAAKDVGSRPASRVRILSGRWQGQVGILGRIVGPGTLMVRLPGWPCEIPFGRCEVEVLPGRGPK